ncbi:MAG: hypothetical protein H0X36_06105 [Sphingomonadaceae bacterium]|nr:hypothetical protein [Sphingomonadaceae bacterium]
MLNGTDMEARVEHRLKVGKLTRAACGNWIFTWNAFRIECDPQSVIRTLEQFNLSPADLRDGAPYQDRAARVPAPLKTMTAGSGGATFTVELAVDPDVERRHRAESDLVIAEITGKPVSLEAALRKPSAEDISGTITITFDADSAGHVWRRTKVTKLETRGSDNRPGTDTITETIERRWIAHKS